MNLIQALNTGYNLLKSSKINSYKIDTEILLSASLKISKEKMILNLNKEISFEDYENFLTKIKRRKANEPIAYILKKKEFYNKDDMEKIKIVENTTQSGFGKNSFIYDFMSSMRQKINDPLGQRAKKRKKINQR